MQREINSLSDNSVWGNCLCTQLSFCKESFAELAFTGFSELFDDTCPHKKWLEPAYSFIHVTILAV
jgi:hypothetical protein